MRRAFQLLGMVGLILGLACSDGDMLDPTASGAGRTDPSDAAAGGTSRVVVMTRNLYVGADVDAVIAALVSPDPNDDFGALFTAIGTLQKTDFPTRAAAIAAEIDRARPHVVGLQEVSQIDIHLPGVDVSIDFLSVLQAAIASRGLHYTVAAQVKNIEAAPIPGVSLVDYDVMLVDANRVVVGSTTERNYTFNIGVVAPGVDLKRGWIAVQGTVNGQAYTFASTHLESGSAPGLNQLRGAQMSELVGFLGSASPVVILGDLNDVPGSLMYQVLAGTGFTDEWEAFRPGDPGYTCCNLADLSNERPILNQRIDYVFTRGLSPRKGEIVEVGARPTDRIKGPFFKIWPSDHAGLVARLFPDPSASLLAQR